MNYLIFSSISLGNPASNTVTDEEIQQYWTICMRFGIQHEPLWEKRFCMLRIDPAKRANGVRKAINLKLIKRCAKRRSGNKKTSQIMICNILNGDSLAYSFPDAKIEGDIIVVREALIEGDLSANDLQAFWHSRARHMGLTEAEYHDKVASEFEKIMNVPDDSEFNLWFEYDLFCQVNMWFVISIINNLSVKKKVYAVYTSYLDRNSKHFWNGFGPANASQLQICFTNRILLRDGDLQLGQELWTAYRDNNVEELIRLAKNQSRSFPYLHEVVKAHIDRYPRDGTKGRPEKVIEDIIKNVSTDFQKVFEEFWNRESIYGFGDTQLKHLYDKVMHTR